MKHTKTLAMLLLASAATVQLPAQNLQLHYDLGHALCSHLHGRPNVTTTIEMFRPDRWGSTFFFADIDYFTDGAAGAYWEVSREFGLKKSLPLALHVEYNGGSTSIEHTAVATRFQHAALGGLACNLSSSDHRLTFSLQAMYKRYFKGQHRQAMNSWQLTAVWGSTWARGLVSLSGYVDVWRDKDVNGKMVMLSEPQLWFNIGALRGMDDVHLSIGTEVELSNNFVYDDLGRNNRFYALPTMAVKWTF